MLENFDYKVPRTKNHVLINTMDWISPNQYISIQKISGKSSVTCITEILKTNLEDFWKKVLKEGNVILLSQIAADISLMRSYTIEDNKCYFDVPVAQIMGVFEKNEITFDSLNMLEGKVLIKRVKDTQESILALSNSNVMIGEVVKTGDSSSVKLGDLVLVKDNVSTEIRLDGNTYYALEEKMLVGIFHNDLKLENMEFLNESILLKPYISNKVLDSSILITPDLDYEDLDVSDIYNRDLFKIYFLDKKLSKLAQQDIVLVLRDFTNYVYFNQEKYHIINGYSYIEALIEGGK